MTRRQPASPSAASASSWGTVSGPCERRSSSHRAGPATNVSRQPRLPQRQIGPCGIDQDVADLAGDAARAAERAPADHQAGADAGRQPQVGHDLGPRAGAEGGLAERADVGVVVEVDRASAAASPISAAGSIPSSQGRIARELQEPGGAVDRRGQAHAGGEHAIAVDAGLVEQALGEPGGEVERLVAARVSTSMLSASSASTVNDRSATATRTWRWPKSIPTIAPGRAGRAR